MTVPRRLTIEEIQELRQAAEGTLPPRPHRAFDPRIDEVFGGIAGIELGPDEFEVVPGLTVRRAFAHVMAPYIMAFRRPERASQPHPGPWRPVRGGAGFDILIEVVLAKDAKPASFDRVNCIWWLVALLRLKTSGLPMVPVVSDTAIADAPTSIEEPTFWPIEMMRPQMQTAQLRPATITTEVLEWVRSVYATGSLLMDTPHFNRAVLTADSAMWSHDAGVAIVTLWAALETLVRPGRKDTGNRLSRALATLLAPAGGGRVTLQQRLAKLYSERGQSAHNSITADHAVMLETFDIARRSIVACLDNNATPDCDQLMEQWSAEHPQNRDR